MRFLLAVVPLMFAAQASAQVKISGPLEYEPHKLARLKAEGVPTRSLLTWSVEPKASVEYPGLLADDALEFTADPGVYTVTLTADWRTPQGIKTETVSVKVTLKGCAEQAPAPRPDPNTPPAVTDAQAIAAIARINFDGAGCTAAAVWPRRADGRWDVYTAAHCLGRVGQKGRMALKSGQILPVTVTVLDRGSDAAWLVTDESIPDLPFLVLDNKAPAAGTKIWHAGFGWEQPGNKEFGEIVTPLMTDGKCSFNISLSQGDSGGPIMRADTNAIIASACCTTRIANKALAFGGSCVTASKLRPKLASNVQEDPNTWQPARMNLVDEKGRSLASDAFEWVPSEMPLADVNKDGMAIIKEKHTKK